MDPGTTQVTTECYDKQTTPKLSTSYKKGDVTVTLDRIRQMEVRHK